MNEIFLNINNENFIVRYSGSKKIEGIIYPIQKYYSKDKTNGWGYVSRRDGLIIEELDNNCRKLFSFCWEDSGDGRIYFEDEEYWSNELSVISKIWDNLDMRFKKNEKDGVKIYFNDENGNINKICPFHSDTIIGSAYCIGVCAYTIAYHKIEGWVVCSNMHSHVEKKDFGWVLGKS